MYYLSREDIEKMAERIISTYTSKVYPKGHLYYYVDPTELAAHMAFALYMSALPETEVFWAKLQTARFGQRLSMRIWMRSSFT